MVQARFSNQGCLKKVPATLLSHPPLVGNSTLVTPGQVKQKDQNRLQQLLQMHNLVALNTWGRKCHCHTYQFEASGVVHRTQIDFLLFRAQHTDTPARSARTIHAPFVPQTGMRHFPLLAVLPKPQAPHTKPQSNPRITMKEVLHGLRHDPTRAARFQYTAQRFSGTVCSAISPQTRLRF